MTFRPYSKPICVCDQGACKIHKRLEDAWATKRRLEIVVDKADQEWAAARQAYEAHLDKVVKEAA